MTRPPPAEPVTQAEAGKHLQSMRHTYAIHHHHTSVHEAHRYHTYDIFMCRKLQPCPAHAAGLSHALS
jgi:hypothetical protein